MHQPDYTRSRSTLARAKCILVIRTRILNVTSLSSREPKKTMRTVSSCKKTFLLLKTLDDNSKPKKHMTLKCGLRNNPNP